MVYTESDQTIIDNALEELIKNKRNADIKTIIKEANPANWKNNENSTLLHLAVFYHNNELAEYAIEVGCNVNAQDIHKNTPLMLVLSSKIKLNVHLVQVLLDADADIFLKNEKNECPLNLFMKYQAQTPVYMMIWFIAAMHKHGQIPDITDAFIESKCELPVVVYLQNAEWTEAVLQRLEVIEISESRDSIDLALMSIDLPNMKVLLYQGVNVTDRRTHFFEKLLELTTVTKCRDLKTVQAIAEHIGDWPIWSMYEVSMIAKIFEKADEEALNIFLKYGFHLRIKRYCEIDLMAHCGANSDPSVIELIRQNLEDTGNFPSVGFDKQSVLHCALKGGVVENLRTFFTFGMDPNSKDVNGRAPLFVVFSLTNEVDEVKRKECVLKLLLNGADPQILDNNGLSILDLYSKDNCGLIQIVLQHLARHELIKTINEPIRIIINSRKEFKTVYESCQKYVQSLKEDIFFGNVSVFNVRPTCNFSQSPE